MPLRQVLWCMALAAALLGAASAHAQEAAPPAPIEAAGDAADDRRIAERLRAAAEGLGELEDVVVTVSGGVVTLTGSAADPVAAEELADIAARIEGVVTVRNRLTTSADVGEQLDPALARVTDRLRRAASILPLAGVALAFAAAIVALGLLLASLRQPWDRLAPNAFIAGIYRQAVRLVFVVIAIVLALDILGATALLGTILGAAGIIGLAVGFAVRDSVENFIASVMLSIRQPFRPNDLVEIEGDIGRVIRLTSRATILLSIDGNHVRIPNASVFKSRIVNYTRNDQRRFEADIGVDPAADLAATRALILAAIRELDFVLAEPAPAVWLHALNETGAVIRFGAWIDQTRSDFFVARGETLRQVKEAVERSGVEVPDTTYRIRLEGGAAALQGTVTAEEDEVEARPDPTQVPPEAAPVEPEGDRALVRLVSQERETTKTRDLLDPAAPEE